MRLSAQKYTEYSAGVYHVRAMAGLLDQRLMPNFVEAALPAGSAIAFDSSVSQCNLDTRNTRHVYLVRISTWQMGIKT